MPMNHGQQVTLLRHPQIPVKIPAGMPSHQAQALIEYLKQNPEQAKQVQEQAMQMLKTPGMASAFLNMQVRQQLSATCGLSLTLQPHTYLPSQTRAGV